MDEKNYEEIIYFVKHGNYPVTVKDKNKKRNFRRRCKPFIFDDGLYYNKKQTQQKVFKWLRKRRQMASLRAYMQQITEDIWEFRERKQTTD